MGYIISGLVFCRTEFVGFHRWKLAPDDVNHLRTRHRHLFKVKAQVSVEHRERAIEYHQLKRQVDDFIRSPHFGTPFSDAVPWEREMGDWSCETMASVLLNFLKDVAAPGRDYYIVEVSEDGENGSVVIAEAVKDES